MLQDKPENYAEWSRAFINELPDSSFLYIAPGGEKDEFDKTKPRSLRFFPVKDKDGTVDLPHLRNAIARIPQSTAPGLTKEKMLELQGEARKILEGERDEEAADEADGDDAPLDAPEEDEEEAYSESSDVVFLDAQGGETGEPKWVELVRSGVHFGRNSERQVGLTSEDIESMARGYRIIQAERWFSTGAPVGYNHASLSGALDPESTKAAGRILDVEVRANDDGGVSLYGLVRWTAEAARRIRDGEFDGFSIEAVPSGSARSKATGEKLGEWALIGGTITNEPFVPGMARVAASENAHKRSKMKLIELLSAPLSLSDRATEAEVVSAVQLLAEQAKKTEALAEALATASADRDAAREELDALQVVETGRMLDRACEDGRIAAAERDRYLNILERCSEEEANHAFPKGRIPTKTIGQGGAVSEPIKGMDAIVAKADKLAEHLCEEQGLGMAAAYARAMTTVLSNPDALALYESECGNA